MPLPNTHDSLLAQARRLGLRAGATLMVHCSLGQVGYTVGGPASLISALLAALGPDGTLVMPCESPQISDPANWDDPRVKPQWFDTIRQHLPVFDAATTPTTMGAVAEAFRTYPGTRRSNHPQLSVCANGRFAEQLTAQHSLSFGEGRGTPFEKLYQLGAQTLLLGVGFDRCTSLHYAESLTPNRRTTVSRFPLLKDGRREWVESPDMATDGGVLFPIVGQRFKQTDAVTEGRLGAAVALLFETRELVDFAADYFAQALS